MTVEKKQYQRKGKALRAKRFFFGLDLDRRHCIDVFMADRFKIYMLEIQGQYQQREKPFVFNLLQLFFSD